MANPPKNRGVRHLRAALLVAIALVVVAVVALFQLGRASRPAAERAAEPETAPGSPAGAPSPDEATVLSEGFDYEQQVAGKPVFRLQGERFTTDREGKVALQGVRLVLYREGEPYEVRSRTAIYDPETRDAQLDGDVQVSGGDGWGLSGARLDLVEGGRAIVSREGRVHFRRGPNLAGSARRLRYDLEAETMELAGQVVVSGRNESDSRLASLAAETMTWMRDGATVVGEGGVRLDSGADHVSAERIDARLRPEGDGFESATATGSVVGALQTGETGTVDFAAASATLGFDPSGGQPASVLLAGVGGAPAELTLRSAGAPTRRLAAPTLLLGLVDGKPSRAAASGGVRMVEDAPSGGGRSAEGERLDAAFTPAGELASAQISGGATLRDGEWTAQGELAELRGTGGAAILTGRPARAFGPRGELRSPTLRFDRAGGRLDATGGVRASFRPAESPIAGGDPRSAGEPVDVESREATFFDAPRRFEFRDEVKAAQGETLLFADRLEGNEAEAAATAIGKVRTQWTDRAPVAQGLRPVVTVITAERLDYRRGDREARYREGVKVRQERREITGDELLVELDAEGAARRMVVTGSVAIDDRESGRSVTGTSADYDLASGEVVVLGEPVVLREASGTTLRGRRALFDQRTGSARLLGDAP